MTRKRRRLWLLLACGMGLGSAAALGLSAFGDNLVFFVSPSDLVAQEGKQPPAPGRTVRLGGLVEAGSVVRGREGGQPVAQFRITDGRASVAVTYAGILPDLFREGQGAVSLGTLLPGGTFRAQEVLARHDETYMPPEVADALKRSGQWKPEEGAPPPASVWNTMSPAAPTTVAPEVPKSTMAPQAPGEKAGG